jgi:hypothetical protein
VGVCSPSGFPRSTPLFVGRTIAFRWSGSMERCSISQRRLVQYPHDLQGTEASMRMFIVLAVAVAIMAIGFGVKAVFVPGSSAVPGLMTGAMTTSDTLSPHEIHLNYEGMKELPVHEIKDPN